MSDHLENRKLILKALKDELVGPAPQGEELDCLKPVVFEKWDDAYRPWKQLENGDEILQQDPPTKRYGIGVLYPYSSQTPVDLNHAGADATGLREKAIGDIAGEDIDIGTKDYYEGIRKSLENIGKIYRENDNDLDLTPTSTYRPSSAGISFLAEFPNDARVIVRVEAGRYEPFEVSIRETASTVTWWRRRPVYVTEKFRGEDICSIVGSKVPSVAREESTDSLGPIDLSIELYARPNPYSDNPRERLVTVCLVNRTNPRDGRDDELCLFQSHFEVSVHSSEGQYHILPYPDADRRYFDDEEQSLDLLYREFKTYAVGHGYAADWQEKDVNGRVARVSAECLPVFETPSTTPDITDEQGARITVSMAALAGLVDGNDGFDELERVVNLYRAWIKQKRDEIPSLPSVYQNIAIKHLERCELCAERMQAGLDYLRENGKAKKAFQLANRAILYQQLNARREPRPIRYDTKEHRWKFDEPYNGPTLAVTEQGKGEWRAFQIAFLLMTLRSAVDGNAPDRDTVELIWFPTGGGKTEAYLGLTAFVLFMRQLCEPQASGVQVITRYTLRLLTAQQFQRASRLICAMEYIRSEEKDLGSTPFSIGIWVGGDNTPNRRQDAIDTLNALNRGDRHTANKFIVTQCPWCGAQMGPIEQRSGRRRSIYVAGYERQGNTVIFRCPETACAFRQQLPIFMTDEDIYEVKPSFLIGTVDKFAMLAWQPDARALFGIDKEGKRENPPPSLIIQDELHLISGPLGSMVGLYETGIEELCTDRSTGQAVRPKIVSSTATIRRYAQQVQALYNRPNVVLFPPPGLSADDSFFATYARNDQGQFLPGRMYVGVYGPGLGSLQTVQVRTFTALLQAPTSLPTPDQQDPWWTLLIFFNSLRELGTTLSLFQSDIPDYLKVLARRFGIRYGRLRRLRNVKELTGRLRSDEVPVAISDLEVRCGSTGPRKPIDACLASNILEVGVDIDRLSLMAVVGQPKSTSQYIQVTGRVGRQWWDRPGLVITIYTASKPRDRSHFEKFRSYHERLYAQVEPVSVTPFSPPALDRALHAIMALYARQIGDGSIARSPYPFPASLMENLRELLQQRIEAVDATEVENFHHVFDKRIHEWQTWQRTAWEKRDAPDDYLLHRAGDYVDLENELYTWPTPTSMRSVDAECQAQITALYRNAADVRLSDD